MFGPFGIPAPQVETCCKQPMRVSHESRDSGYRWKHYRCDKCQKLAVEKLGPIFSEEDLDAITVLGNHSWGA